MSSEKVETTLQRCQMNAVTMPEKQENNYRWIALIIASVGTLPVWLDSSFNIAFPAITSAFHLDVSLMQWAVIAYVLTTASMMLGCGRLADVFGRKTVFVIGLGVVTVALALCGLAPTYASDDARRGFDRRFLRLRLYRKSREAAGSGSFNADARSHACESSQSARQPRDVRGVAARPILHRRRLALSGHFGWNFARAMPSRNGAGGAALRLPRRPLRYAPSSGTGSRG